MITKTLFLMQKKHAMSVQILRDHGKPRRRSASFRPELGAIASSRELGSDASW